METNAALIRSDSRVELNSETAVYLNLAVIVNPGNAEENLSLGLNDSL